MKCPIPTMEIANPATCSRTAELAELVKETLSVLNAFAKSKTSKLGMLRPLYRGDGLADRSAASQTDD